MRPILNRLMSMRVALRSTDSPLPLSSACCGLKVSKLAMMITMTVMMMMITSAITILRQASTIQNTPDLPTPALQWTTRGWAGLSRTPPSLTENRSSRKESGDGGTPKSGQTR